ncbi:MAG: insulinase family protein [bacterium]|nr:insulinase family protein [bacterium]
MKFNKTIIKNGLRVITIPMTDNPSVTVLVMVETGSKYETKPLNGISHFLEHMVFKGTPRRPKASDISRELDSIGAHYNAFTGHEYTGYYAKAATRHLDTILDIVSDMYMNPLFETPEIEKEKGVIVEEIRMYNDMPQFRARQTFAELLYGDQPAGWDIAGTEENVKSFTRENFIDYRNNHYVSSATTVIVSGSFDEVDCISKIEKAYEKMISGEKKGKVGVIEDQKSPQVKTFFKETDQTHLVLGVRSFAILDKRMAVMHVLSTILGKGMSSRLFSRMRDELGVCYYIKTDNDSSTDHGVFTISAGVDNSRVEEALKEILVQCKKLKAEAASEAELQKAKDYISGTTLLELETSESRAEFAGFQEIMKKKVETPVEMIEKINAVTSADVQKLAQELFIDEALNMAIVGKFKDGSSFMPYFKF